MDTDIVVASTPRPPDRQLRRAARRDGRARRGRPIVLIDIAVPRDIEHDCARIEGVTLYDMDDLEALVAGDEVHEGRARKQQAEEMVDGR